MASMLLILLFIFNSAYSSCLLIIRPHPPLVLFGLSQRIKSKDVGILMVLASMELFRFVSFKDSRSNLWSLIS